MMSILNGNGTAKKTVVPVSEEPKDRYIQQAESMVEQIKQHSLDEQNEMIQFIRKKVIEFREEKIKLLEEEKQEIIESMKGLECR